MKSSETLNKHIKNKSIRQLIAIFRNEYITNGIEEKKMSNNPIVQFDSWFKDAVKNKINEPNIMHLATSNNAGKVSGRAVLLKEFDEKGFVFYTNYNSHKSNDLEENNNAALTFLWMELFRQIRIEGIVYKVTEQESDVYFQSRPRESQIGAIASSQSKTLNSREELEHAVKILNTQFENKPIPRPANWGGYRLVPSSLEFWQGRANRLHDRILYASKGNNLWEMKRLFP